MKWTLLIAMVLATVLSDLLQSREMKIVGEQSVDAHGMMRLLKLIGQRRYLILSVACLAVSFFSFMALVQTQPLSLVVPFSAASFILETMFAKWLLKERVGARRAAGTICVLCGVILLGR